MRKELSVAANENGLVRVFALSMDEAAAKDLKGNLGNGDGPLALALGCHPLDKTHTEVFPLSDLGDMALADYLIEGAGVMRSAINPDRLKLASLRGWILIVYSSAFDDQEQSLSPSAELTLIGVYPQEGADWGASVDLSTPSALPQMPEEIETKPKKRPSDAAMSGRIAMVALLVAFAVVGLMFWVGS